LITDIQDGLSLNENLPYINRGGFSSLRVSAVALMFILDLNLTETGDLYIFSIF
jgi:hypothetical protein